MLVCNVRSHYCYLTLNLLLLALMTYRQTTRAKLSLILVGWVVLLCLTKNIGVSHAACPMQFEESQTVELVLSGHTEAIEQSGHCELSGKLLQQPLSALDFLAPFTFVLIITILAWLRSLPNPLPYFTEPIVYPVRLHVRHSVFRE